MRDIRVTGLGIVSALGRGVSAHAKALIDGRSGLSRQTLFDGAAPDPCVCGMVPAEVLPVSIDWSAADRANLLLDMAVGEALTHAKIDGPARADLCIGSTLGNMHGATRYYRQHRAGQPADYALLRNFLVCAPPRNVARKYALSGKTVAISSACGSGAAALGCAARRIQDGLCDIAIAGGVDALTPFVVAGFNSLRLVSSRESMPFDRDRSGLNPGEGAAVLVLETAESATRRGVKPLAALAGFGEAFDAFHHTRSHPEGTGLTAAIHQALDDAGIAPRTIGHAHLHGTGTEANDLTEYRALSAVFGRGLAGLPVCSSKPMTGHTFGAAGAVNALFSVLSIERGALPATRFHANIDPRFQGLTVLTQPRAEPGLRAVLTTAMGFGGESFALVFTKTESGE
jgi:3-oxoacyl-(acyl-carrier-protein) synthase